MDDKKNHTKGSEQHVTDSKDASGLVEVAGLDYRELTEGQQDPSVREILAGKMDAILQSEEVIDLTELADSESGSSKTDIRLHGKGLQSSGHQMHEDLKHEKAGKKTGEPKKAETGKKEPEEQKKAETGRKKPEEQTRTESGNRKAEEQKKADADRKKPQEPKKAESDNRKAEKHKKTESDRKALEEQKKTESDRKASEEQKKTESDRKASEEQKKTESDRKTSEKQERSEADRKATNAQTDQGSVGIPVNKQPKAETKIQNDQNGEGARQPADDVKEKGTQELAASEVYESKNPIIPPDRSQKILRIGLSSVAAILLLVYLAGVFYYSGHFYGDATINGVDVSGMKVREADQALEAFYDHYVLRLKTIDADGAEIDGDDISMQIEFSEQADSVIRQQGAARWFLNAFKPHAFEVHVNTSWDQDALDKQIASLDILNEKKMESPKDAYVGVKDGKFSIFSEKNGNKILPDQFQKTVEKALSNVLKEVDLVESGCYLLPQVRAEDPELIAELEEKAAYESKPITLKLDDLALEPGMELYDRVLEKNGDSFRVSSKLVKDYVAELAKQYNTVGSDRSFVTSFHDKEIQVTGPTYGYEMDQDATAEALIRALDNGQSAVVDVVFSQTGSTMLGNNDIGKTYIEVNLSEQRVIAYKNGRVIAEGDCVSGNESQGHGTCVGLYAIQNKQSPTVLRGEKKAVTKTITKKKKGKKVTETKTTYEYEYESPVTYWMPFNGGIGLHDAAGWRSAYGGSIYYYSGSHGCVNLPLDLAKNIYNNFEVGTPVVVYFWDNENRK